MSLSNKKHKKQSNNVISKRCCVKKERVMDKYYRANYVYIGKDNQNEPLYMSTEEAETTSNRTIRILGREQEGAGLLLKELSHNVIRFQIESNNRAPMSGYKRSVDNFKLAEIEKVPDGALKDVFGSNRILALEKEVNKNTKEFNRLKEYTRELEVEIEELLHKNKLINSMNVDVTTLNAKITNQLLFQESVTKKIPVKEGSTTISTMNYKTKLFRKENNKQTILNFLVDNTFSSVNNLTMLMSLNRSTIQKILTQFTAKNWVVSFKRKGAFKVWGITDAGAAEVSKLVKRRLTQKIADRCQLPHTLLLQRGIMKITNLESFEEHRLHNTHINTGSGSFVPDMIISNNTQRVCVEAELNVKSKARYAIIYRRYESAITENNIAGVYYYFDSEKKRDRVLETFKKLSRSYNKITEEQFNNRFHFLVI